MDKEKYFRALELNNGEQDEYAVGSDLGLTEEKTKQILDELEAENRIEFRSFGLCSYVVNKI